MPQSNIQVSEVDLQSDFSNYYRGSYLTYQGKCAYVVGFTGQGNKLKAQIRTLGENNNWSSEHYVLANNLDFTIPRLGFVEMDGNWFFLSRRPARRMHKGYCDDNIVAQCMGPSNSDEFHVSHPAILKQVWEGNTNRISHDVVIIGENIFYQCDQVAKVIKGKISVVKGKEKIGEYVCKLLAANWDSHSSKHSLLPLDS